MNAMIFAAGLGTRLFPLTQNLPKALVEINGKPMLWYALNNVIRAGATRIVINVHHFADQIVEYIEAKPFGYDAEILISDERNELLETGGGLLKAAPLFFKDKPILIHNSDVLTNANLADLVVSHQKNQSIATLMVENRKTSRYFLFNEQNRLIGWENQSTGDRRIVQESNHVNRFAFDGIQIVEYDILNKMGAVRRFSITSGYLELANNENINGWVHWDGQWFDIGTPEKLQYAANNFKFNVVK